MKANRRSRFYEEYADEQLSRILTSLMVNNATTCDDKVSSKGSANDEASAAMSSDSEFEDEDNLSS